MKYLTLLVLIVVTLCGVQSATNNSRYSESISNNNSNILSRRKRFIVFPDGSSFQLVWCTQNQGYLQIGDIVWFGNTAALAWELPTDPKLFYYFKDKKAYNAQRRNDDNKHILYLDEVGKVLAKVPYRRKILVNPAFAKRSVDGKAPEENTNKKPVPIKKMHDKQLRRAQKMELENVQFHRESRKTLYDKLESFIEALGWKGRECVLRLLCEAGQAAAKQGSFMEEITRAVFTLPPGQAFERPQHAAYDAAHQASDCHSTYPDCQSRISKIDLT